MILCEGNAPPGFFNKDNTMNRFIAYIKDTRAEMSHVNWPTRQETVSYSTMVILVSIATAILLGISDFVFSRLLTLLFH